MLLEEFSTIFYRPEKVKKLREYILSLAVRGKLVEQDENDEPAKLLLERIKEEKDRLVKEKKIKKEKPLPEISEDEILYELPKGWEWVRLGQIVELLNGRAYKKTELLDKGKTPVLRVGNFFTNQNWYYSDLELEDNKYCDNGDLLYAWSASFGPKIWTGNKVIYHYHIWKVDVFLNINKEYLYYMLLNDVNEIKSVTNGTTMVHVTKDRMEKRVFPLPPLNEQKRIVEKVDYLMEFCDKLEEQLEKQVKYATLSAKSVLNGVSNCSSYEELEEALRFIIENFKDLTLADGAVGELKNAILSLAVKGKLVPQDDSDEPASVLLDRIREEKDKLVKEKKIKKEKALPEISEEEIYYELPKGWEWVRLNDISSYIQRGKSPKYCESSNIPVISQKCIQWNGFDIDKARFIEVDSLEKYGEERYIRQNDLLWNSTGKGTLGRINIYPENIEFDIVVADSHVTIIRPIEINSKYLYCWFGGPIVQNEIDYKSSGSTKQTELSTTTVKSYLVPIPPLNEQKRIVEKVDKLIKVCDELELRIKGSKKYNEKLMESILKESFKA